MSDDPACFPTLRRVGISVAFLAAGGIGALCILPEPEAHAAQPVPVMVAGAVEPGDQPPAVAAQRLALRYLAGEIVLRAGVVRRTMRRAELGVSVDIDHLAALLAQSRDGMSAMRRAHEQTLGVQPLQLMIPAQLDTERALAALLPLKDQLDRPPRDAHIDPRKKEAVPARQGQELDLYGTLERIDRALIGGETVVELALFTIAPRRTIDHFEQIDMSAVLGEFSTRYNRADRARDRTHNLKTAAEHVDGYVLQPGAEFDFNEVVGDRNLVNGFREAPVIASGELVDGMGGGTCQIASTLHAAVFFAGLPILTRSPHSRPSYYIKLGLDAAVAYGSLNFRFKNDRPYPIVIELSVDGGFVHAALHGAERRHTVSFLRRIDETVPFEEKVIEDSELPRGERILAQRGIPGFRLTRFRVIQDERTGLATRESSTDTYPPTTQIWREGTGPEAGPDYERPKNDAHPEYLADEFMVATQGPGIDGIELDRSAGRTGTFGWTEREGMAPAQQDAAH